MITEATAGGTSTSFPANIVLCGAEYGIVLAQSVTESGAGGDTQFAEYAVEVTVDGTW